MKVRMLISHKKTLYSVINLLLYNFEFWRVINFVSRSLKKVLAASSNSLSSDWDDKKIQHLQTFKHVCKTSIIYIYTESCTTYLQTEKNRGYLLLASNCVWTDLIHHPTCSGSVL